jgi:hypothetical protein
MEDRLPVDIGHNGGPDLYGDDPVDFDLWFDATFRKPDGSKYSRRARQVFVKRFQLPVISMGWSKLIVPSAGNARIASLAKQPEEPARRRGPGRPRAVG